MATVNRTAVMLASIRAPETMHYQVWCRNVNLRIVNMRKEGKVARNAINLNRKARVRDHIMMIRKNFLVNILLYLSENFFGFVEWLKIKCYG